MTVPRLVVVLDRAGSRLPVLAAALRSLDGGADQIQLREPGLDESTYRVLALELISGGLPARSLTVNGHPWVARDLGANLHLPERLVGTIGCEDVSGLLSASIHGPVTGDEWSRFDYLIAGNVFETGSKPGKQGIGISGLREIVQSTTRPVLAIGGITPDEIPAVLGTGAFGVAVRSFVIASSAPDDACRRLKGEINRWTT